MKKIFAVAAVLLAAVLCLPVQSSAAAPATYKEYKALYQKIAETPEGAVYMYFDALFAYMDESRRAEASKMLRYSLASEIPLERSPNYRTFIERLKNPAWQHVFRSFYAGTSPENNYTLPDGEKPRLLMSGKKQEHNGVRVYLRSTGADSIRSVVTRRYGHLWHVVSNSDTYVGVRPPRAEVEKRNQSFDADFDLPEAVTPPAPQNQNMDFPPSGAPFDGGASFGGPAPFDAPAPAPSAPESNAADTFGTAPLSEW